MNTGKKSKNYFSKLSINRSFQINWSTLDFPSWLEILVSVFLSWVAWEVCLFWFITHRIHSLWGKHSNRGTTTDLSMVTVIPVRKNFVVIRALLGCVRQIMTLRTRRPLSPAVPALMGSGPVLRGTESVHCCRGHCSYCSSLVIEMIIIHSGLIGTTLLQLAFTPRVSMRLLHEVRLHWILGGSIWHLVCIESWWGPLSVVGQSLKEEFYLEHLVEEADFILSAYEDRPVFLSVLESIRVIHLTVE